MEYALFGNATYKFNDRVHLTGGMRWAKNEQTFNQSFAIPLLGLVSGGPGSRRRTSSPSASARSSTSTATRWSMRELLAAIVLAVRTWRYPVSRRLSIRRRSRATRQASRRRFLDRVVSLDAAVFLLDWNDLQIGQAFANWNQRPGECRYREEQRFRSGIIRLTRTGAHAGRELRLCRRGMHQTTPTALDGDRLPNIPKASGAVLANYDFPLSGTAEGHVGGTFRFVGDRISGTESAPDTIPVDGYSTLDLQRLRDVRQQMDGACLCPEPVRHRGPDYE